MRISWLEATAAHGVSASAELACPPLAQEIVFFEEGEPLVDGEAGDLKVCLRRFLQESMQIFQETVEDCTLRANA